MKKLLAILFLTTLCVCGNVHAQSRADEMMKQAQENLAKKRSEEHTSELQSRI